LWSPLVDFNDTARDALIVEAGWDVLPHRSKECSPCVNSNRTDFRTLDEIDIEKIDRMEAEMGRTMFRVARFHTGRWVFERLCVGPGVIAGNTNRPAVAVTVGCAGIRVVVLRAE
jgi:hypothetical protein